MKIILVRLRYLRKKVLQEIKYFYLHHDHYNYNDSHNHNDDNHYSETNNNKSHFEGNWVQSNTHLFPPSSSFYLSVL